MSSNYTVVFDACVLYPAPLRSLLMYLGVSGEFRARWSDDIHDEWIRNALKNNPEIKKQSLERVRTLMDSNVPGALVSGYHSLIPSIVLPDVDDRHVVAVAIQANAEAIITFNLKDFPEGALAKYDLQAIHPDDFIADLYDLNAAAVIEAARSHRASLKNPPFGVDEYLDCLLRQRLTETVARLKRLRLTL